MLMRRRFAVAILVGLIAAAGTRHYMSLAVAQASEGDPWASDFAYWWQGARALLDGANPYVVAGPGTAYPLPYQFAYPLPASVITLPLAGLSHDLAAQLFVGLGFFTAAMALTRQSWWPLAMLVSAPALLPLENGQWSPFLLSATVIPALGGLLVVKPTIGLALAVYNPRWPMAVGAIALLCATFVLQPTWVTDWFAALTTFGSEQQYVSPLAIGPGWMCLLALLRWRRPEARLLLALSCVPQNYFMYDQLYLLLIPRSWQELSIAALWTHLVAFAARRLATPPSLDPSDVSLALAPFVIWGMFLPSLILVLARPNRGRAPAWAEHHIARLPVWLRGAPPCA